MHTFQPYPIELLDMNPFTKIGKDWALLTAGSKKKCNTMTVSWGGLGVLWGTPSATIYIRPQRYTREFIEKNELFTISFFKSEYKKILSFCGSHSGRDCDKAKETGLTPIEIDGTTSFEEAELILVCRKKYSQNMTADSFLDKSLLEKWYPNNDLHTVYIGEIITAYQND